MPIRSLYRFFRSHILQRLIPKSNAAFDPARPVEIVGYLSMMAGVGESARLCADALSSGGREILLRDVSTHAGEGSAVEWKITGGRAEKPGTRIWHLNPPMLPRAIISTGFREFAKTYNIGYWAWELETVPAEWRHGARYVNAVFVPSEFTRRSIAPLTKAPVIVVPHPVTEKPAADGMRAKFGIEDEAFLVSFIFSAGSSINRKNPQAVINAFLILQARCPKAFLLMKGSGDPATDAGLAALFRAAAGNSRIKIVTEKLTSGEINGLIRDSDAYISLHRSEGFGLTLAEAIMHRTPVVTTAWSGTVDFCDPENTWNVEPSLIPVVDTHPEFASLTGAVWADPSPETAAEHLLAIYTDRPGARAKAENARSFLLRYLAANTYEKALETLASR
jgi:glycosyltransferase involved in cell wall biosynthesis